MKRLVAVLMCFVVILATDRDSQARTWRLTKTQGKIMKIIVEECAMNYDTTGVDAATCGVMAMQESTLGKACSGNNLWGINSGRTHYGSLRDGIRGYLKVINNGYYGSAPFTKSWRSQLRKILDGGYCQPEGAYYSNCMRLDQMFDFDKYSKRMWKKIKKLRKKERKIRKEQERQRYLAKPFKAIFDPKLWPGEVVMDPKLLKRGTLQIGFGYYEVVGTRKNIGNTIYVGTRQFGYTGGPVKIENIFENAVG